MANGLCHFRFVGMASLFVIVGVSMLQDYVFGSEGGRRYEARVEVGCVRRTLGGMSRGWRRRRCCLAEAAEVVPEDIDARALMTTRSQTVEHWL
jgi:hypothetical protein